jgi:hypothetical protein
MQAELECGCPFHAILCVGQGKIGGKRKLSTACSCPLPVLLKTRNGSTCVVLVTKTSPSVEVAYYDREERKLLCLGEDAILQKCGMPLGEGLAPLRGKTVLFCNLPHVDAGNTINTAALGFADQCITGYDVSRRSLTSSETGKPPPHRDVSGSDLFRHLKRSDRTSTLHLDPPLASVHRRDVGSVDENGRLVELPMYMCVFDVGGGNCVEECLSAPFLNANPEYKKMLTACQARQ